jgi:hypothetical protein
MRESFRSGMQHVTWTLSLFVGCAAAATPGTSPIPHLEHRGHATQLIVDGHPWLMLAGELNNTAPTDSAYLDSVWPKLVRLNLNTVLVPVAWDWIEPVEGTFDFSVVDNVLAGARRNHLHVVFLWFGSWKNGVSTFAPVWVKADSQRFARVRVGSGVAIEMLSPFSQATRDADERAYVKFMQYLNGVDTQHTALMIQLENEVGINSDTRDRSEAANRAFAGAVPRELMDWLAAHRATLSPTLLKVWNAAGARTSGSWQEIFGDGPAADELFMDWQYARTMDHIAAAGKAVYPLPVFTNSVTNAGGLPGEYPAGAPEPWNFDVWKAAAPSIDLNCPDISRGSFEVIAADFHRADNPLFVPEGLGIAVGVANAFYAVGAQSALGYSVFGIDNTVRLIMFPPLMGTPQPTDLESLPLAKGYAALRDLAPHILAHQSEGTLNAAWLNPQKPTAEFELNGYTLHFELRNTFWDPKYLTDLGYGIAMAAGPDEFYIAGADVQVTFKPMSPGPSIAGLAVDEAGHFRDGRWVAERKLNGDDVMLNYRLLQQSQMNLSGSGARFGPEGPTIQHVKLYRFSP